jgi:hypothetical protein
LQVPLVFRNYVTKIEDKFPELKAKVPPNIMKHQILHMGILQRKYNWLALMKEDKYSEDIFIKLVKSGVKEEFFRREKMDTKELKDLTGVEKVKYERFLDVFCEAIASSTEYVNKVVAHSDFGKRPKQDLINVFEKAYNEYVTVFYDAVVGSEDTVKE